VIQYASLGWKGGGKNVDLREVLFSESPDLTLEDEDEDGRWRQRERKARNKKGLLGLYCV